MFSRAAVSSLRVATRTPAMPARRSFFGLFSEKSDMEIKSDDEQASGRRKKELDDEKQGLVSLARSLCPIYFLYPLSIACVDCQLFPGTADEPRGI